MGSVPDVDSGASVAGSTMETWGRQPQGLQHHSTEGGIATVTWVLAVSVGNQDDFPQNAFCPMILWLPFASFYLPTDSSIHFLL